MSAAPSHEPASNAHAPDDRPHVPWWIDASGWIGSLTVLGAHAAVSLGELDDGSALYAAANVGGSLALVVMCVRRRVWPAVCLNATWAVVAGVKLVALAL